MKNRTTPDSLGLHQNIDRRDFISGVAVSAVLLNAGDLAFAADSEARKAAAAPAASGATPAAGAGGAASAVDASAANYPPALTGLRGQYPGSFEMAHAARDGKFTGSVEAEDTGERYDLVIVGGGISGLSAAHFFREALGDDRKILILDNHDDFGGHAKRNEFHYNGRMYLGYGGTMSIESPFPYSYLAKSVISELGIDVGSYEHHLNTDLYKGLGRGVFFDKEHFGGDRVIAGAGTKSWEEFFGAAPLAPNVRADLIRIHTASVDYMPDLTPEQKAEALKRMSYQDFLLKHANLLPASLPYFTGSFYRNNMRVDTCPAYVAARSRAPGFKGITLPGEPPFHSDYEFHFPDGNATIARLLVSRLVPGVFPPGKQTPESIVTARANYAALDVAANPTKIRLQSMAIRVEHTGKPATREAVRVVYVRDGKQHQVLADNVVMACFNNIIRFVVPSLPEEQKQALAYASKVPMQYTNVLVRNWLPWKKLGVNSIQAPNGYHTSVSLDFPVSMGDYKFNSDPNDPIVLHLGRNPNQPGLPRKAQHAAGRADMLATPFAKIEMEIRTQLSRMLGPAGFDAKKDILGITVNRWPHGYAYTYDTLGDPDLPEAERPHVLGRKMFGRIAIANADSAAAAFTNTAIDQAHRAVQEVFSSRGLV